MKKILAGGERRAIGFSAKASFLVRKRIERNDLKGCKPRKGVAVQGRIRIAGISRGNGF